MRVRAEFEQALLVDRVAIRATRFAMEHDSPEALAKYLQQHPDADKAKHTVKKPDAKAKGGEKTPEKKPAKKDSDSGKTKLDKALAKASPHDLRNKAEDEHKAGRFDKAFEQYSAAAEVFRSRGDTEAAKSMDAMAKEMAKRHQKTTKRK